MTNGIDTVIVSTSALAHAVPTAQPIADLLPPAWAAKHFIDGPVLCWERTSDNSYDRVLHTYKQETESFAPYLFRSDMYAADPNSRSVTVEPGPSLIQSAADVVVTPVEARKLAAILIELADAADGVA